MRKLITVLLIICMIPVISAAELSGLTFDQLIELQQDLTAEIVSRPEWQEVTVPAGEWVIGVDIPAGYYSIKSTARLNIVRIEDQDGRSAGLYKTFDEGEVEGKTMLPDGMIFTCSKPVVLMPPMVIGF